MELTLFNFTQFPRFKCHKEVRAAQIGEIRQESKGLRIFPNTPGVASFCISDEFYQKHRPVPGGYIVVYADGYVSFSPKEAFEEGYVLIPNPEEAPAKDEPAAVKRTATYELAE